MWWGAYEVSLPGLPEDGLFSLHLLWFSQCGAPFAPFFFFFLILPLPWALVLWVLVLVFAKLYPYPLLKDYIVPKNDLCHPFPKSAPSVHARGSWASDISFIFLESIYAPWVFLRVEGDGLSGLMHPLPRVFSSVGVGEPKERKTWLSGAGNQDCGLPLRDQAVWESWVRSRLSCLLWADIGGKGRKNAADSRLDLVLLNVQQAFHMSLHFSFALCRPHKF